MLLAAPAPLTSDESLYLAEGYNIASGNGPTYPSGELVTHRPPLFPALLAGPIALSGGEADAAYIVPKLIAVALIVAAFLLGRELFGDLAGVLAALLVASSAFLRWLGTTLFLDGAETLFMLLALTTLARAFKDGSRAWFALAGALAGAAFLTKEAAVLWLPLPLLFALLSREHRTAQMGTGIAVYAATAAAMIMPWWLWVYVLTGRVYLWGEPSVMLAGLIAGASAAALVFGAIAWWATRRRAPQRLSTLLCSYGLALSAFWLVTAFVALELTAAWPYPREFLTTVPTYLRDIAAPNTQPWPLIAAGLAWLYWRSMKDANARVLVLAFVLFLPFALHIANRGLSYRDALPLVYLSYVATGGLMAALLQRLSQDVRVPVGATALAGLAVFAVLQTNDLRNDWLPYERDAVSDANWDNPLAHDVAQWIHANVPSEARIMSSRLYFSHLYVLDRGEHPVYQLPTVRVDPDPAGEHFLKPASTLFRWEDTLADPSGEDWVFVRQFPVKDYFVALSQGDLLRSLGEREIDYLVVSGEDSAFSSLAYLDYFEQHPAFRLLHADRRGSEQGVYVFAVDRHALVRLPYETSIDASTLAALASSSSLSPEDVTRAIGEDGVAVE